MNQIIVPTGYMGSGSSAITGLLAEIDGFNSDNGSFEYVFMHCPDGLFDLEDKLLLGNNVIRSDEAMYRFRCFMKELFDEKNFWPGMYKKRISNEFMTCVDKFLENITTANFEGLYWYFSQNPDCFSMQCIHYLRRLLKVISCGKIKINPPVKYNTITIAFPDEEEFYGEARNFLNSIFIKMGIEKQNLILDQLLLPHNLHRIDKYFNDNLKVIVVDRDPRDVFVLNKYVWHPKGDAVPYPLDVYKFIDYYSKMRKCEKEITDNRILRIHFEDLVYNYDDICNKIYDFLGISTTAHINKRLYFNPDVSIKNTQLYNINEDAYRECMIIEKELEAYIYNFNSEKTTITSVRELF